MQLLAKFEAGHAVDGDVEKLLDICDDIGGKSFCALADGAVACVTSAVRHFRAEFEAGYTTPAWELFPYGRSALFPVADPGDVATTVRTGPLEGTKEAHA